MICARFGSKDALFDRVIEATFEHAEAAVPFTPDDRVGYATSSFDCPMDHPDPLRIDAWAPSRTPGRHGSGPLDLRGERRGAGKSQQRV